jgi:glucosamine kinase
MVVAANGSPSPNFAALLRTVLSAADSGDAAARAVLTQAGVELATLAKIVIVRLFGDAVPVPVAVLGGVFRNCGLVQQVFYDRLRAVFPQILPKATPVDPVKGALELARRSGRL